MTHKLLLSVICLVAAASATAQNNLFAKYEKLLTLPTNYTCYRTTEDINIDGKLDELSWQKAPQTASFADISGKGFPTPKQETHAKMLWDEQYLYIGATLKEKDIKALLTKRDTIIYYDNDFEVFLNPEGNGRNYFEIETNARGVVFDLMLDKPYRSGGNFFVPWNCTGLKLAISRDGTLNNSNDTDTMWSVEMAIPHTALTWNFNNPLQAGKIWRINFSRVEYTGKKVDNWVWMPTGKVDMHMPERWAFVYFSDKTVGANTDSFQYPYDMSVYKLLWAMFYEQMNQYKENHRYYHSVQDFSLTNAELKDLPQNAKITVEATSKAFNITISIPDKKIQYSVNQDGQFNKLN